MDRRGSHTLPVSEGLVRAIISAVDDGPHGTRTETICERLDESPQRLGDAFEFIKENRVVLGFAGLWMHPNGYEEGAEHFLFQLENIHRLNPDTGAIPPWQVVQRTDLGWTHKATVRIVSELIRAGRLKGDEEGVRLPGFVPQIGAKQEITLGRVVSALEAAGFRPPVGPALAAMTNLPTQALREVLRLGEFTDRLVPMENGIWTTPDVLNRAHRTLRTAAKEGMLTIAVARTALDASRRYAHAFLLRLTDEGRAVPQNGEWQILEPESS